MSLPPLQSITALETLDRLGSVKATAEALNLTQSAVSHKLKGLQYSLGFPLTLAHGRGVILTSQARQYVHAVRPALTALRDAHQTVSAVSGALTISCAPGFAAYWLTPKLTEFGHLFPDITLELLTDRSDTPNPRADVSIRFTAQQPTETTPLMRVAFFPVCTPEFAHSKSLPKRPNALNPDHLLHVSERDDWQTWLDEHAQGVTAGGHGILFDDVQTMLAAAHSGQGLCLGDHLTCDAALRKGDLIRPFDGHCISDKSYIIEPGAGGHTASSRAFESWVREQI